MQQNDPHYRPGAMPGSGPYQAHGPQNPYGQYWQYRPTPPFDPYEAERKRESRLVRTVSNRFYAGMILALAAVGIASVVFWLPAHLAEWADGTSHAISRFSYGWGVVLTQALPLLLGELVLLLIACRFLDSGFRPEAPPASAGRRAGISLLGSLAGTGAGLVGSAAFAFTAAVLSLLGINLYGSGITIPTQTGPRIAVLVFLLVLSPVLEELIFRGVMLKNLCRFGERFAIIAGALMFAFFHFQVGGLLRSLLVGVVMGCLAVRVGNIGLVAGARVLSELLCVMVQISFSGFDGWYAPGWLFALSMVVLVAAAILIFAFPIFYLIAAEDGSKGEAPLIHTSRRLAVSLSGPSAVVGIIACMLYNIIQIFGRSIASVL